MSSFEVSDGTRLARNATLFADEAPLGLSALRESDDSANAEVFESSSAAASRRASDPPAAAYSLLESVRHGVLLIDDQRRVCFANEQARDIVVRADAVTIEGGQLRFLQRIVQTKFESCLSGAKTDHSAATVGFAMSLPRSSGARAYALVVKRIAADGPVYGCHIYDLDRQRNVTDTALLRQIYGLTPAEGDVAMQLFQLGSVELVARALAIRESTVRAHLTKILRKCEVRSIGTLLQHLALGPFANA